MIKNIQINNVSISVQWTNGEQSSYPFIWLRDMDPLGFHPETLERTFDLTSVEIDIIATDITFDETGISLQWNNESERSFFPSNLLTQYENYCQLQDPAVIEYQSWLNDFVPQCFDAHKLEANAALKNMLLALKKDGVVIITRLVGEQGGENFGDLISFKRETNFGVMFEVINKVDPNNLAYTALSLPLHTDLSNQELPPGYQFLHCIKNDAVGGESLLADGFAIAEGLRDEEQAKYKLLCERKMPFRFYDKQSDIRFKHCLISEYDGVIDNFIFNAHLADCVPFKDNLGKLFYQAYQNLMSRIRDEKYAIQIKLQAGEMMIFDNRRVLHGRNSFDPSTGGRHLRGYYIDRGEIDSKLRKLSII